LVCAGVKEDIMLIIIDKNTKKVINNMGTNSAFPDGNIPNVVLKENEQAIRIHDNSELAQKIQLSKVFEPVIENGEVIDINIVKSYEQYLLEHPKPPTPFEKAKGKYNAADKASLNHMDIVKRIEILEELLMLKEG
jgi:hypothetical protein